MRTGVCQELGVEGERRMGRNCLMRKEFYVEAMEVFWN